MINIKLLGIAVLAVVLSACGGGSGGSGSNPSSQAGVSSAPDTNQSAAAESSVQASSASETGASSTGDSSSSEAAPSSETNTSSSAPADPIDPATKLDRTWGSFPENDYKDILSGPTGSGENNAVLETLAATSAEGLLFYRSGADIALRHRSAHPHFNFNGSSYFDELDPNVVMTPAVGVEVPTLRAYIAVPVEPGRAVTLTLSHRGSNNNGTNAKLVFAGSDGLVLGTGNGVGNTDRTSSLVLESGHIQRHVKIFFSREGDTTGGLHLSSLSRTYNEPSASSSSDNSSAGNNSSSGGAASSTGGANSSAPNGGSGSSTGGATSSTGGSQSSLPSHADISNDCIRLAMDTSVNWRDMPSLQTDQEIVECLSTTLGRAVGYGENALGGYDPGGNSKLTIINTSDSRTVEEQLREAIDSDTHNWIVFDKVDFANEYEISFHRLWCADTKVLTALGSGTTVEECNNYRSWCTRNGISDEKACLDTFFNKRLHNKELSNVRNPIVGSNTTIDGRQNNAFIRFMGFRIGNDSGGVSTQKSDNVIITYMDFRGAGHTEDHALDPDMIRNTGESEHIWIHKNSFYLTGDSAFDVKVGARYITMSFNKVTNVVRAVLHGSSDGRVINEKIRTTMHHNEFLTTDEYYRAFGNTARRVPLLRRGTSHLFNNVFTNYRKDIMSGRVGASILFEDNAILVNQIHQEKSSLEQSMNELQNNLVRGITSNSSRTMSGVSLWFSDGLCKIVYETERNLDSLGTTVGSTAGVIGDLRADYNQASRDTMLANYLPAGQDLVDYISATAGRDGQLPFNSPLSESINSVLNMGRCSGEPVEGGGSSGGSSSSAPAVPEEPSPSVDNLVEGQLTVTWPAVGNASSYSLRYGITDDMDEGDLIEVTGVTSPYVISSLDNATTYYVFLRANGVNGNSDWVQTQATTFDPTQPPVAPATPVVRGGDQQLTATWPAVAGATSYEVIYNTADTEAGAVVFAASQTETSATITGLINDTTYYVFVRASNANGDSDYSPSASATPTEAEPASCYVDDFTGDFGTLSIDGAGQVNSFEWSGRRISYGSGVLKSNNSEGVGLGFFTEQSDAVELREIGDRIRLIADFTIPSATRELAVTELRVALVQSVGERPIAGTADIGTTPSWSTAYKAILGSTAYNSRADETVTAGSMGIYERNQSNSRPMGDNSVGGYTSLANSGNSYSTGSGLAGVPLTLELTIELVDDGKVDVTFSYKHEGVDLSSMTIADHTTTTLSFDGVGVFFRRNGHIEFNNFVVEYMPVGNVESPCTP